jgi:rsbT co-antagonist protein RsbR
MADNEAGRLAQGMERAGAAILDDWAAQLAGTHGIAGRVSSAELGVQCRSVLAALQRGLAEGGASDIQSAAYEPLRAILADISKSRATLGFSPSETALFLFSLKRPIFDLIRQNDSGDARALAASTWFATQLIDGLGLFTIEVYQKSRDEIVMRQQEEIAELSTPVVKLWDGILALPLIGTLDSARTQVVMENLLQAIVDQGAEIAIIDITGVPTVDTLVAQHLLKTIAAARLMGADCIVSGIRPQIAQTMVHLGVELNVTSKSTLADALVLALQQTGRSVVRNKPPAPLARSQG